MVHLFHSIEILVLFAEVVFKYIRFPLFELFSHGHNFLLFFWLNFLFVIFWLGCLPWDICILILQIFLLHSLVEIMKHEFLKNFIFVLGIAKFFGHKSWHEQNFSELVMVFAVWAPCDRLEFEFKFTPKTVFEHFEVDDVPVNDLKLIQVDQVCVIYYRFEKSKFRYIWLKIARSQIFDSIYFIWTVFLHIWNCIRKVCIPWGAWWEGILD